MLIHIPRETNDETKTNRNIFSLVSDAGAEESMFFLCRVKNSLLTISNFSQFHENIFNFLIKTRHSLLYHYCICTGRLHRVKLKTGNLSHQQYFSIDLCLSL